ncbi:MAG: hypothetical protein V2I33_22035 [Kangiellaceae bacterium]|jgi:hypothetical protein|nr:hypothetical protein [Kangiellaceae bacterium]
MEAEDDCWPEHFAHRLRIYSSTSEASELGDPGLVESGEPNPEVLTN